MKHIQKHWLGAVPWEKVLTVNQTLCQAQNAEPKPKAKTIDAARQLWEKSAPKEMSLPEVLDVCRKCQDLGPFVFNNGNTFAAISKDLVEELAQELSAVEAQIFRTTVSHYVNGQVEKPELLQVLRHLEPRWKATKPSQSPRPIFESPQVAPSAP